MAMDMENKHHVVAMPYPGRGHINPMLNLCTLLLSFKHDLRISFVVTEEWLDILTSDDHLSPPANLQFVSIPQVIPSEIGRAANFSGFLEAILTKLQDPFENVLDSLNPPATAIIYDTFLPWVVGVGNKRNIPMASLFTQSALVFTVLAHSDLMFEHGDLRLDSDSPVSGEGNENVDYIPGLSSTNRADLPTMFHGEGRKVLHRFLEAISAVNKAQYLLFTSIYELEEQAMNALKAKLHIPIYPIGPMIPYFKLKSNGIRDNYLKWLDSQPVDSVLYISQGSYHSIPCAQMDEIVAGIIQSGVRFLRVTRDVNDGVCGSGYLVNWCNQLKVLSHPCIGGFLTHCGWNSTCEGIYAGVPMLTGPLWWDQVPNSKLVVSDWKIGLRLFNNETLVTRHEIAHIVRKFMDPKCDEQKEMVNKVKMLQEICRKSIAKGGSAASNLQDFITNMFAM